MIGRLDRHLLGEVLRPTAATLLFLFQLLFAMQLLRGTDLLFGAGARATDLLWLVVCSAPHFVVLAAPIAFLVGVLVGLGRLAEDRELTALAALGMSPLRLLPAPMLLAAALSLLGVVLASEAEPLGIRALRLQAAELIERNLRGEIRPGTFFDGLAGLTVYAGGASVDGGWSQVLVHDDRDPSAPLLLLAREGHLDPLGNGGLALELGQGELHGSRAGDEQYAQAVFAGATFEVALDLGRLRKGALRASREESTSAELEAAIDDAQRKGAPRPADLATTLARRTALPFAPLFLGLVAVPLASGLKRQARAGGAAWATAAFAAYYVVARLGQQWGDTGRVPPWFAANLANLLFALLGLALLARAGRRP